MFLEARRLRASCQQDWFLLRPFHGLRVTTFLLSHLAFLLHTTYLVSLPLLTKTPVLLDQGDTLMTSFNPITSLKARSSNTVTLGVKISVYEFQGDTVQSITDINVDGKRNLKFIVMFCRVHTCIVMSSVVIIHII